MTPIRSSWDNFLIGHLKAGVEIKRHLKRSCWDNIGHIKGVAEITGYLKGVAEIIIHLKGVAEITGHLKGLA